MKSFRDRNPYVVGAISVMLILGLVGGAFAFAALKIGRRSYVVTGVFSDGSGIKSGDDVKMAGINIGFVKEILPDRRNGNVRITLDIESKYRLAVDTRAEISLETLLGTKAIRVTGAVRPPYLASLPAKQRIIPIERTKVPFDVFETLKVGTRGIEATDSEKLNTLIRSLADVTQGNKEDVGRLLKGVGDLSETLNTREAQLKELLDRAERLTGVLAEKDQTLVALVDHSKKILDLLNSRRDDIGALLHSGNALVAEIARILNVNSVQIDALLKSLHPTVETVKANQGELDKLLAIAGPGAYGLALSGAHGPWQDIYVQGLGPDLITVLSKLNAG
jgi:phospholipid/cholesterol/gamma-HCH transport system substrate-binding protein